MNWIIYKSHKIRLWQSRQRTHAPVDVALGVGRGEWGWGQGLCCIEAFYDDAKNPRRGDVGEAGGTSGHDTRPFCWMPFY